MTSSFYVDAEGQSARFLFALSFSSFDKQIGDRFINRLSYFSSIFLTNIRRSLWTTQPSHCCRSWGSACVSKWIIYLVSLSYCHFKRDWRHFRTFRRIRVNLNYFLHATQDNRMLPISLTMDKDDMCTLPISELVTEILDCFRFGTITMMIMMMD